MITRYLGPEIYGRLAYTIALVGFFNIISDLGFNLAHNKRISEGHNLNDCFSTYLLIKLFLLLMMMIIFCFSIRVWSEISNGTFSLVDDIFIIIIFIHFVILDLGYIAIHTFNAQIKTAFSESIVFIGLIVRTIIIICICLSGMGINELGLAYIIGSTVICLIGFTAIKNNGIRIIKPTLFSTYATFALPMAVYSAILIIYQNIDKLILGFFWGSTNLGYYAAPQSLLLSFSIVGIAIGTVLFPGISKLHNIGDLHSINKITLTAERYVTLLVLPPIIVIILFPYEISVLIFGQEFGASGEAMRYLAIASYLNIIALVSISEINASNRPKVTLKIMSTSLIISFTTMLILIPESLFGFEMAGLGGLGAAISNVIFMLMVASTAKICTNPNDDYLFHFLIPNFVAGLGTVLSLSLIHSIFGIQNNLYIIIYLIFSWILYTTFLLIIGGLNKYDIKTLVDICRPTSMIEYFNNEINKKK